LRLSLYNRHLRGVAIAYGFGGKLKGRARFSVINTALHLADILGEVGFKLVVVQCVEIAATQPIKAAAWPSVLSAQPTSRLQYKCDHL
jgi:hypothetical protein